MQCLKITFKLGNIHIFNDKIRYTLTELIKASGRFVNLRKPERPSTFHCNMAWLKRVFILIREWPGTCWEKTNKRDPSPFTDFKTWEQGDLTIFMDHHIHLGWNVESHRNLPIHSAYLFWLQWAFLLSSF